VVFFVIKFFDFNILYLLLFYVGGLGVGGAGGCCAKAQL
jgi:hypothetical protein